MKKILVIDDDDAVRDSFIAALDYRDYAPTGVGSGLAGIESATREKPDLVFLDLKMPGMSGVETLAALRALYPELPIYLVTGFYGEFLEPLKTLRGRGVLFELARKPLTVSEIRAIAEGVLAPRDAAPTAKTAASNVSLMSS